MGKRTEWILQGGIIFILMLLCIGLSVKSGRLFMSNQGKEVLELGGKEAADSFIRFSFQELSPLSSYIKDGGNYFLSYIEIARELVGAEILPGFSYAEGYWGDVSSFVNGQNEVPGYFLEAGDAEDESSRQEDEEAAEDTKTGAYTEEQLASFEFLTEQIYQVDSTTKVLEEEIDAEKLLGMDLSISTEGKDPKILIYHTHGSEAFKDSKAGEKSDTVIGVGDRLKEILEDKYEIKVYHDRGVYDQINGALDRSKAYTYAGEAAEKLLKKYPSIEVVIDLHRDSVGANTHLVTKINGKQTAKIMFFNGMSRTSKNGDIAYLKNENKQANLAFSFQLQLAAAERFPDFTRKIYLKGYRYNMHLKARSLLIEVGAENNTVEEAKNAMEPLAAVLNDVLSGKRYTYQNSASG